MKNIHPELVDVESNSLFMRSEPPFEAMKRHPHEDWWLAVPSVFLSPGLLPIDRRIGTLLSATWRIHEQPQGQIATSPADMASWLGITEAYFRQRMKQMAATLPATGFDGEPAPAFVFRNQKQNGPSKTWNLISPADSLKAALKFNVDFIKMPLPLVLDLNLSKEVIETYLGLKWWQFRHGAHDEFFVSAAALGSALQLQERQTWSRLGALIDARLLVNHGREHRNDANTYSFTPLSRRYLFIPCGDNRAFGSYRLRSSLPLRSAKSLDEEIERKRRAVAFANLGAADINLGDDWEPEDVIDRKILALLR